MSLLMTFLDFVLNSLILTSIAFALFSVLVYLILTRFKDEKYQFITAVAGGFLLVAVSDCFANVYLAREIILITGTVLIIVAPVVVFKRHLNKKDDLPAVFLISLIYPAYFRTTQYSCGCPDLIGYYPWYVDILGNFVGPLILSLSALSFLIFIRKSYENFRQEKYLLIPLLLLIPGIIWFSYSIASASVSVLMLISLKELQERPHKIADFWISTLMVIAAFIVALPWPFLIELPCIQNYFPVWIIPVLAVSLVSTAPVYYMRSMIPEKWIENCVFILCFAISAILLHFSIWFL